jgi:hypothetical protein
LVTIAVLAALVVVGSMRGQVESQRPTPGPSPTPTPCLVFLPVVETGEMARPTPGPGESAR